jgi:hypothetical protein
MIPSTADVRILLATDVPSRTGSKINGLRFDFSVTQTNCPKLAGQTVRRDALAHAASVSRLLSDTSNGTLCERSRRWHASRTTSVVDYRLKRSHDETAQQAALAALVGATARRISK